MRLLVRLVQGPLLSDADLAHTQDRLWALPAFHNPGKSVYRGIDEL